MSEERKKQQQQKKQARMTGMDYEGTDMYAWTPAEKHSSLRFFDDKVVGQRQIINKTYCKKKKNVTWEQKYESC